MRREFPNEKQMGALLWHKDRQDRRIVKVFVDLNDVADERDSFKCIPQYVTSPKLVSWQIYYKIWQTGFLGISDEEIKQLVPETAWRYCPSSAGTVIFVDTQSVYDRSTLHTGEQSALFFVHTAKNPKRADLCT